MTVYWYWYPRAKTNNDGTMSFGPQQKIPK